jgi:hypothetical protein
MNKKTFLLVVSAAFLGWSVSHASITSLPGWTWSGGIYCSAPVLGVDAATGDQSANLNGNQKSYGTLGLTIITDTAADPTMIVNNSINNTSPFVWTEYILSVAMNQNFSIDSAGVIVPGGWTATITAPTGPDISGNYVGTIDYKGGTAVALGAIFDFGYQITFSGSTSYSLTESANPVPEPGVLGLLVVGGLLVSGSMVAKRRQAKLLRARA